MTPAFDSTPHDSPITQTALPLLCRKDEDCYSPGTALMIAPCFGVTARHVIEDAMERYGVERKGDEVIASHHTLAFQFLPGDRELAMWRVLKSWPSPVTDVAFLHLVPANAQAEEAAKARWKVSIDLRPPDVGDEIQTFGYHSGHVEVSHHNDIKNALLKHSPTTSIGTVQAVYMSKRDSVMLPFPCFETNARFDGGMSGGPVFRGGRLCGLICSSFDSGERGSSHTSFVALLWPALLTRILIPREGQLPPEPYPAIDLAKHGFIDAIGWEQIVYRYDPSGQLVELAWFQPEAES